MAFKVSHSLCCYSGGFFGTGSCIMD